MSHLLKRTKKSCLKLLRKISTSRQLFVQRLDEEEEEYDNEEYVKPDPTPDIVYVEELQLNHKQYECHNNNNNNNLNLNQTQTVQPFEFASEAITVPESSIEFELVPYKQNIRYLRHTPSNSSLNLQEQVADSMTPMRSHVLIKEPPLQSLEDDDNYAIVKWDINGNSLDEERFDLRSHWEDFDSRWRQAGNSYSQKSSYQSSSCTLETWIDDAEPIPLR